MMIVCGPFCPLRVAAYQPTRLDGMDGMHTGSQAVSRVIGQWLKTQL